MRKSSSWMAAAIGTLALVAGALVAANKYAAPKTVLHVVTVLWTADSTDEQRQAALDGVKKMAEEIPGIRNVWIKTLKVQGRGPSQEGKPGRAYNAVFAIEFENPAALDRYADHPAHRAWEKIYLPIREQSTTHDVTN